MDAASVEAEPAAALGAFAIARAEFVAIVTDHIVFAGHIKNRTSLCGFEKLIQRVEFRWLGKMRQVPGVQNEIRRCGQGVDFGDGLLEGADDIGVGRLVKTDVAVADLHEAEISRQTFRSRSPDRA